MKLRVDPTKCSACGSCWNTNRAIFMRDATNGKSLPICRYNDYTPKEEHDARFCISNCPFQAIQELQEQVV